MRILTNVSKAELDYLTSQPTAKAMIEKVKTEGIYISEGDAQGAAEFMAMRAKQKQEVSLQISEEGKASLKKEKEGKEKISEEDLIKEQLAELQKELAKLKSKSNTSDSQEKKINNISRQIMMLNMQLIQIQKNKTFA